MSHPLAFDALFQSILSKKSEIQTLKTYITNNEYDTDSCKYDTNDDQNSNIKTILTDQNDFKSVKKYLQSQPIAKAIRLLFTPITTDDKDIANNKKMRHQIKSYYKSLDIDKFHDKYSAFKSKTNDDINPKGVIHAIATSFNSLNSYNNPAIHYDKNQKMIVSSSPSIKNKELCKLFDENNKQSVYILGGLENWMQNEWISMDFVGLKIRPTYYRLKCDKTRYLMNWDLEAYDNENQKWCLLIRHQNDRKLENNGEASWKINTFQYFSKFRIRETGVNSTINKYHPFYDDGDEDNYLYYGFYLKNIEIYGDIAGINKSKKQLINFNGDTLNEFGIQKYNKERDYFPLKMLEINKDSKAYEMGLRKYDCFINYKFSKDIPNALSGSADIYRPHLYCKYNHPLNEAVFSGKNIIKSNNISIKCNDCNDQIKEKEIYYSCHHLNELLHIKPFKNPSDRHKYSGTETYDIVFCDKCYNKHIDKIIMFDHCKRDQNKDIKDINEYAVYGLCSLSRY